MMIVTWLRLQYVISYTAIHAADLEIVSIHFIYTEFYRNKFFLIGNCFITVNRCLLCLSRFAVKCMVSLKVWDITEA